MLFLTESQDSTIFENKKQLKRRFIMISKFRSPLRREIIPAAALLAVLSIALLTEPRTLLSQSDEQSTDVQNVIPPDEAKTAQYENLIILRGGTDVQQVDEAENPNLTGQNPGNPKVISFSMGKVDGTIIGGITPMGNMSEEDVQEMLSKIKERIANNPDAIEVNEVRFRSGTITDAQNGINPARVGEFRMVLRPISPDGETQVPDAAE
jgi:hypothetical protein